MGSYFFLRLGIVKIFYFIAIALVLLGNIGATAISVNALTYPSLDLKAPTFANLEDEEIREAQRGQQIVISESIKNTQYPGNQSLFGIIEIRDQNDVTIYLAFHSAILAPEESYSFGISWIIPENAPDTVYTVRTFAISSFGADAQPLSTVLQRALPVL